MARKLILGGVLSVAILGAVAGVATLSSRDGTDASDGDSAAEELNLATVEQRDLERGETIDGTVTRGTVTPVQLGESGTLTALPAVGDLIQLGSPIAEVDGKPVILLPGNKPLWRELGSGVEDGADIEQFEAALVALGYADPEKVTVDDEWDSATTAAVKKMQKWLGMDDDGRISVGEVVFAPQEVRVATVAGAVGGSAGSAGIEVTSDAQVIEAELDTSDSDMVAVGDVIDVELPNGDHIDATVWSIGAATTDADGAAVLPLVLVFEGLAVTDGLSVKVNLTEVQAEDAITVPAEALLALAEGGYAVEVPDETSQTGTRLVPVDIGVFADGYVQITGDIAAGDEVVVPS